MLRGDFNPLTCPREAKRQEPVELPPGAGPGWLTEIDLNRY